MLLAKLIFFWICCIHATVYGGIAPIDIDSCTYILCQVGKICRDGACVDPLPTIFPPPPICYFPCPFDRVCKNGQCVCKSGKEINGQCVHPCSNILCPHPDKICKDGKCVCKDGLIEHFGKCVGQCKAPKVYKRCPTNCPRTCEDDPNVPILCSKECAIDRFCVCPPGYVERSKQDSTCVKENECPLRCFPPMVISYCTIPNCKNTCDNVHNPPVCPEICLQVITCVCGPGYIMKSDTDETCVKKESCPKYCKAPKVYNQCPTACPDTCDNIDDDGPRICPAICRPGVTCVCPPGYVERSSTDSTCVKREDCPNRCKFPKVYRPCPTACPDTCDNIDDEGPRICPAVCRPGVNCVCPVGYVERSSTDSTCVKPVECPGRCKAPKVFNSCPTACPRTCENINDGPFPCILICRPGVECVCPKGYVEKSSTDSTCVKESECNVPTCELPADPGPCEALIPSFYFDAVSGGCRKFNYGGCKGNANRFATRKECEKSCSICKLRKDVGPCDANYKKYYYNQESGMCERFSYGGCKGNANRFNTKTACMKQCGPKCKAPKVYNGCPTACPRTCENPNPPPFCVAVCRPGVTCVCPKGYVEKSSTDSTCVKESNCHDNVPTCQLPKDPGPCEGLFYKFYFNAQRGKCERFQYGGCGGNANRFDSRRDCENSCSICKLDKDPGPCEAAIPKYFYNYKTADCQRFIYGGCEGNANRFNTMAACRKACRVDPCIFMYCGGGMICKDGECIKKCDPRQCGPYGRCIDNKCVSAVGR